MGIGVMNYPTKVLMMVGFAAIMEGMSVKLTLILGVIYTTLCFFIGYIWVKIGLFEAEQEVSNVYNLFVKEVRKKIKKKSI